jgi:hypothetical protein
MQDNKDQREFREKLLDLLEEYGVSISCEGTDGCFVDFDKGDADAFYFEKADATGFDT